MNRIRVGVLRGGPSNEYDVSLKTGGNVIAHLGKHPEEKYQPIDIFIDRNGDWHIAGVPVEPHHALDQVDVVWNALHGAYGEDGKVQQLLDRHEVPYTGSGAFASAVGMNKVLAKETFLKHGIKTPRYALVESEGVRERRDLEAKLLELFRSFTLPFIVKPVSSGSSVGVSVVKGFHEFESAIFEAFKHGNVIMIEEFIPGVEATCGVIDAFRDTDIYALPPIEIRPHRSGFFDFAAKYEGKADEIVPGNFTHEEKDQIMHLARAAHTALGLRHYSRSDFIVSPKRGIYILEVNTLPGLTDASLLPKALQSVGVSVGHFLDHVIGLALVQK